MNCRHCGKEVFGKEHDVEDFYKEPVSPCASCRHAAKTPAGNTFCTVKVLPGNDGIPLVKQAMLTLTACTEYKQY